MFYPLFILNRRPDCIDENFPRKSGVIALRGGRWPLLEISEQIFVFVGNETDEVGRWYTFRACDRRCIARLLPFISVTELYVAVRYVRPNEIHTLWFPLLSLLHLYHLYYTHKIPFQPQIATQTTHIKNILEINNHCLFESKIKRIILLYVCFVFFFFYTYFYSYDIVLLFIWGN